MAGGMWQVPSPLWAGLPSEGPVVCSQDKDQKIPHVPGSALPPTPTQLPVPPLFSSSTPATWASFQSPEGSMVLSSHQMAKVLKLQLPLGLPWSLNW